MKRNLWILTLTLIVSTGVISAKADETAIFVETATSGTSISGYVDTAIEFKDPAPVVSDAPSGFHKAVLPEPTSGALLALGGIAFGVIARRRQAK